MFESSSGERGDSGGSNSSHAKSILFVTPYYPPQTGGVATYVESIQRLLRERGHQVYVLVPGTAHGITPCAATGDNGYVFELYLRLPWVKTARLKGFAAWIIYVMPTLYRLATFIRQKRIDTVVLEYPLACMYYFKLLRRMAGIRLVVGIHGDDVLSLPASVWYERVLVEKLIRGADWLVAHSSSLIAAAERIVGHLHGKQSCIPYGVEAARLQALASRGGSARISVTGPFILTVAKLYPWRPSTFYGCGGNGFTAIRRSTSIGSTRGIFFAARRPARGTGAR